MTDHDLTDTIDLDDWAEVRELLTADATADDDQGDVDLLRIGGHLLVIARPPGRWRARHRRRLHRLGFRPMPPTPAARLVKWRWSVPAPFRDDELRRVSAPHDVLPSPGTSSRGRGPVRPLTNSSARTVGRACPRGWRRDKIAP